MYGVMRATFKNLKKINVVTELSTLSRHQVFKAVWKFTMPHNLILQKKILILINFQVLNQTSNFICLKYVTYFITLCKIFFRNISCKFFSEKFFKTFI